MTCIHCDPGVDCAHDRETDEWIVPKGLTPPDCVRGSTETSANTPSGTQTPPTPRARVLGAFSTNRDGGDRA